MIRVVGANGETEWKNDQGQTVTPPGAGRTATGVARPQPVRASARPRLELPEGMKLVRTEFANKHKLRDESTGIVLWLEHVAEYLRAREAGAVEAPPNGETWLPPVEAASAPVDATPGDEVLVEEVHADAAPVNVAPPRVDAAPPMPVDPPADRPRLKDLVEEVVAAAIHREIERLPGGPLIEAMVRALVDMVGPKLEALAEQLVERVLVAAASPPEFAHARLSVRGLVAASVEAPDASPVLPPAPTAPSAPPPL